MRGKAGPPVDFNRIAGSNQNNGQSIYSYNFDQYGNRWHQTGPVPMTLSFTGNNNRIDGYSYDAAGNLSNDGTHKYYYDAESRIIQVDGSTLGACSTATACYVYNASGERVRKTTGGTSVDYLYDLASHEIIELSSSGVMNRGEVYAGNRHIATYELGTTYLNFSDWLGTKRLRTLATGVTCETITNLPFGDDQITSGSCADSSPMHFTGKQRDVESNLDNFGARYDSASLGRFMTPDLVTFTHDPSDPQTWNKYSYAFNRPTVLVDFDGRWPQWFHHQIFEWEFGANGHTARLGPHGVKVMQDASDWVDCWTCGNQAPDHAYMHAMRDGTVDPEGTYIDVAELTTQTYIDTEVGAAVDAQLAYQNSGHTGYSDDALKHLGHAMHTAQDWTSPQHRGFQPWFCLVCRSGILHTLQEDNAAVSQDSEDAEARHEAYVATERIWNQFTDQLQKKEACKKDPSKCK